jgi:hypothetical protein
MVCSPIAGESGVDNDEVYFDAGILTKSFVRVGRYIPATGMAGG